MNSHFNAIDYSHQLQSAGVPQPQAEVHARAVSQALADCTASKADLAALDEKLSARMAALENRIIARMDAFETRIVARVDAFEANVKLELSAMRVELAEMRGDIKFNRWMSSITLALVIAAIAKLYFP